MIDRLLLPWRRGLGHVGTGWAFLPMDSSHVQKPAHFQPKNLSLSSRQARSAFEASRCSIPPSSDLVDERRLKGSPPTLVTTAQRSSGTEETTNAEHLEFSELLQGVEGEEEADDLLKRQLERSIAGSNVIVLRSYPEFAPSRSATRGLKAVPARRTRRPDDLLSDSG